MSKFNTFLVAIGMVFLAFSANAQLSYTLVPSNATPVDGETITVDVVVNGFTDIASYQYSINWNASHFDYMGVSNFNLTGLSAGNFGTTQTNIGRLGTLWSDPMAASQSLADGTVLFTITFDVISDLGTTSDIIFSNLPVGQEVIQDQGGSLTEITNDVNFNDTNIELNGGGSSGGGLSPVPCTSTGFGITVTNAAAATGEQFCLDVAGCNFTDIVGVSYTMQFDPTTLQFDNVTNFNIPDLEAGSFGTNNAGNGFVTLAWFDPMGTGVTIPDQTIIYSVCFTAIGAGGEVDSLLINGELAQIDITDVNSGGNDIGLESTDGEVQITGTSGSAVTILASQEQGSPGDTVTVDITVRNFDSIIGLQYSMLWDPAIIRFHETIWAGNLPGVPTFNTSSALVDAGKLTFLWTDPTAQGVPLPDDELLFSIRYIIDGEAAEESAVNFTSDPTAIEISQVIDGNAEVVPLAKIPGLVEVIGQGVLTLNLGAVTGSTGDIVCVPVTVQNFNEIVSMQYDVSWNTSELTFINVEGFNLNGLGAGNFNPIGSDRLRLSWVEALLSPQTLADGDTLYSMCFEILADDGISSDVIFDQGQIIEFTAGAGANPVTVFVINDGTVEVVNSGPTLEVSDTTITNVACNGESTGAIDISIINDSGTVTYAWSNSESSQDISGLDAGTYTVTITDDNVTVTETYTVTEPTSALAETTSSEDITCNGDDDGTATVVPSGGTAPYTYAWTGGGSTAMIDNLGPGTYTVTVTDANMCTVTGSETIDEPSVLTVSTSSDDVSVNGGNDGEATATPSGGTPNYTYAWTGGGNTATITGLTAGTYTVTVTDMNMCTETSTVVVGEPGAVSASITASTNVSCNGDSDGSATVTPGGGVDPYEFEWSSNAGMTATVTNLSANTYTVTVTDANGTTATADVTITEPTAVTASVSDDNVSCNGGSDGTATATPGGGAGNYTFVWDTNPTQTTAMITGLSAGQYSVTITDADGCEADGTTFVSEPSILTLSGTVTQESGAGTNDGTINITPGGGVPGYTYDWADISPSTDDPQNRSSLSPGNYTVTMTDANGCTISEMFVVNSFDAPQITVESVTNIDCNGDNTGAIDISVSGGLTPYIYAWPGGVMTEDISGLTAGSYIVTVTDNIGTTAAETITVTEASTISIVVDGQTNASCFNGNDGSISVSVSGGTPNYTYNWGSGVTTEDPSGLTAGTYTLTVTDGNGCTEIGPAVTITEPSVISIAVATSTNINCNGDATGSIDINVSGGTPNYTYNWGGGIIVQDPTGLTAGTYTVTVTDANGCTQLGPAITLTEPTAIIGSSSATPITCNGESDGMISVNVSGGVPGGGAGYNYNWSPILPNQPNHTGVAPGTYNVTITDAVGCSITLGPIPVTQPAPLTVSNTVTNASAANNDGAIDLTVTGGTPGYTFDWSTGANTEDLNNLSSGCYAVTVSDINGCEIVDSIKVGGIIAITSTVGDVSCAGTCDGTIDIEILGGIEPYTYSWSGIGVVGNAQDQSGLCAGDYAVTVSDSNGSLTAQTFTVGTPSALTLSNSVIQNETGNGCNGSINITITGGTLPYAYTWSNGASNEDPTDLCKGDYDVTVSDANGCVLLIEDITVLPPPLVVSTSSMTMVSCNGDSDGEACLSVLGGCGPYTFTIGGQTQVSVSGENICFSGLSAGAQTVTIVDSGTPEMTLDHNFTITEPAPVSITVLTAVDNTDPTGANCNGSIDIDVSGGTGDYTYLWSNGEISEDIDNVCESPPSYCVTVTDGNGCTASICEELDLGLSVSVISSSDVSCFGDCDGAIDIEVFGGVSPYSYIWGPSGETVQDPSNLCAGTHTVTITDSSMPGIQVVTTVTIDEPTEALSVAVGSTTNPTGDNANGAISLDISGGWGVTANNIVWSDGITGNPRGGLTEGFYTATITDNNGCVEIITVELVAFRLTLAFDETEPTCNGDDDGQLELTVNGGSGDYTYVWSAENSGANLAFNLTAGTYSVTVIDNVISGLSAEGTFELLQPDPLEVTTDVTPATGPADGSIEAIVIGGTPDYEYIWTNGENTPIITRLAANTYGLQVTDVNGCTVVLQQIEVPIEGECFQARKVITPNNDGKNDDFQISCIEGLNNNLKVFNRWGQMVYEIDNYDNSWSGTGFDDNLLPESGYFWVLEYEEDGQTKQLKGAFTLLRGDN